MIDKKGRSIMVYMHVLEKGFMFMHICFVLQIGEKEFDVFVLHVYLLHLHTCL